MRKCTFAMSAVVAAAALSTQARAGVYKTISIDGDFSDWSDVPAAATAAGQSGALPFASLKIANDDANVYFLITYSAATDVGGLYGAVDSDNSPATGYNIFGNPAIGSNFGIVNDFPFTETASSFNSGGTVTPTGYASAPSPFSGTATTMQEISLSRTLAQVDASAGGYTGLVFTPTFGVEFYNGNNGNTIGPVSYSLALVPGTPEPATLGAAAIGGALLTRRRRGD